MYIIIGHHISCKQDSICLRGSKSLELKLKRKLASSRGTGFIFVPFIPGFKLYMWSPNDRIIRTLHMCILILLFYIHQFCFILFDFSKGFQSAITSTRIGFLENSVRNFYHRTFLSKNWTVSSPAMYGY